MAPRRFRLIWRRKSRPRGRPPLDPELVALIRRMASENFLWGAERIRGELIKLGFPLAKRTVQKYMRGARPPRPPGQSWRTFIKNHATDIWAADFVQTFDIFFKPIFALVFVAPRLAGSGPLRRHLPSDRQLGRPAAP